MQDSSFFSVRLQKDGSFPKKDRTQIYYLRQKSQLLLQLHSRKCVESTPFLLSNLPKGQKVPPSQSLEQPSISQEEFQKKFTLIQGKSEFGWQWQVDCTLPGPLFLQIIFVSNKYLKDKKISQLEVIFIEHAATAELLVVQPDFQIDSIENYTQISMLTLLPKQLGPSKNWQSFLENQHSLGYNAFHFAPVQELGGSKSQYSIKNQHLLNPELFKDNKELKKITDFVQTKLKSLSFIDILLNHTSSDSEWLLESTDSYFNVENTPNLKPAFLFDQVLMTFGEKFQRREIFKNNQISSEQDIDNILVKLKQEYIDPLKLEDYFCFNSEKITREFKIFMYETYDVELLDSIPCQDCIIENIFAKDPDDILEENCRKSVYNQGCEQKGLKLNFIDIVPLFIDDPECYSLDLLQQVLERLNIPFKKQGKQYLEQALKNLKGQLKYRFLELNRQVSPHYGLFEPYFTVLKNGMAAANNGWILDYDASKDFIQTKDFHYLQRNIVIWGDLVKLRYGESKKDSPYLWKFMKQYVQQMAQVFTGFRLDNAHSTPIAVAQYFMRKARQVNPKLHIFCELFTNNAYQKALYIQKLGANFLVRESLNCHNTHQLATFLHTLGDMVHQTLGHLPPFTQSLQNQTCTPLVNYFIQYPKPISEMIYDQTHDNRSYFQARTFQDQLPRMALLSFSNNTIGSTFGFDEWYKKPVSVVNEDRLYAIVHPEQPEVQEQTNQITFTFEAELGSGLGVIGSWDDWKTPIVMNKNNTIHYVQHPIPTGEYEYRFVDLATNHWFMDLNKPHNTNNNILSVQSQKCYIHKNLQIARILFNKYQKKSFVKYPELYLEDKGYKDMLVITRSHTSHQKYLTLIARSCPDYDLGDQVEISIVLPGKLSKVKAILSVRKEYQIEKKGTFSQIAGQLIKEFCIEKYASVNFKQCIQISEYTQQSTLNFVSLPPSMTILLKTRCCEEIKENLVTLEKKIKSYQPQKLIALLKKLSASDLNYLLYSCAQEEKEKNGNSVYQMQNILFSPDGYMHFAGLFGIRKQIENAMKHSNLALPLFDNIRQGNWILDYFLLRLDKPPFGKLKSYLQEIFDLLFKIQRYLIPKYLCIIMTQIYETIDSMIKKTTTIQEPFFNELVKSCYQFVGEVPSAYCQEYKVTLAAGLPHFSTGYVRCWGRDTFISMKGSLLIPKLFNEAKQIIFMFGSALRHGLIPNLLDQGINSRYNCRDACWWFIKSVGDYMEFTKENILNQELSMCFLSDNQQEHFKLKKAGQTLKMKLSDIIQKIFQSHAEGIYFREWRAGYEIDSCMQYEGFNINLKLDKTDGIIYGGNAYNCLTWMDKMGSSHKAGNLGTPATSRDGAPIEMTCLLKKCLSIVGDWQKKKLFPFSSVFVNDTELSYSEWGNRIESNFEQTYYIPLSSRQDENHEIITKMARIRGIYRDVAQCSSPKQEYQLRPNAVVALTLAPELFKCEHVGIFMDQVQKYLLENDSIGLKTLDKSYFDHCPFYDNSDDGEDARTAQGFSYHNGPEWVWLYGYYVKAMIMWHKCDKSFGQAQMMHYLENHMRYLAKSEWLSLPELTNQNGRKCYHSCETQAWSVATLIEAIYEIYQTN